jgi:perosamine synthetase
MEAFAAQSIDARVFFWPLSSLRMLTAAAATPVAHELPTRAINLPTFHDMSDAQQDRVMLVVHAAWANAGRAV